MNGGTCLRETPGKRLPSGRKKNVRCNRSSLLTNSLPYKEGQAVFRGAQGLVSSLVRSPGSQGGLEP